MVAASQGDFIKHNSPAVWETAGLLCKKKCSPLSPRADLAGDARHVNGSRREPATHCVVAAYDFTRNVARNALRVLLLVHLSFRPSPWYD